MFAITERYMTFTFVFVFLLCAAGIRFSVTHFKTVEAEVGRFITPPAEIAHLSFGFSEVLADFLWIRVVQDFGYCEARDSEKNKVAYDYARVIKRDDVNICHKGWVYQMIDRVTDLDPNFHIAFAAGGTMLSLLVNDPEGAQAIFTKGARRFPTDWSLLYRAGYHQLFEMKNNAKAAQYFYDASKNGAPPWLAMSAARLYTKEGKAGIGKVILEDFAKNNPDMASTPRFKALQEQVDNDLRSDREPATTPAKRQKK